MARMGDRYAPPIPNKNIEQRTTGSGPVITYQLTPDELAKYRAMPAPSVKDSQGERARKPVVVKSNFTPEEQARRAAKMRYQKEEDPIMLTKDKYLQLRLDGMNRTKIQKEHFPKSPPKFYAQLEEWGIKTMDAEERELDLFQAVQLKTKEPDRVCEEPIIEPVEQKHEQPKVDTNSTHQEIKAFADKNLNDEIERLRKMLEESDQIRRNASGAHATVQSRLQEQIEQLESDNAELVKSLEAAKQEQAEPEMVILSESVVHDPINHPAHYKAGGIETIDFIRAKLTPEEFTGYCKGNVLKYVTRANLKGGDEDLRKAAVYLGWAANSR